MRATGVTTLMVTHDVLDAVVLADRIVVLDAGRVVESGTTTEVLTRPRSAFAARIAGLDLVPGRSCVDGLRTAEGTVVAGTHPEPVDDGESAVALFAPAVRGRVPRRAEAGRPGPPCPCGSPRWSRTAS